LHADGARVLTTKKPFLISSLSILPLIKSIILQPGSPDAMEAPAPTRYSSRPARKLRWISSIWVRLPGTGFRR
jgi:hypothetical protein